MEENLRNPLISVIVPIYNQEKYLEKCVESILKQTYSNIEVILVDDGSSDQSVDMCDQYKKIDNRVIVIHKNNGGLSDARNKGLDIAKGDYISFIDSDDFVRKDMFDVLLKRMTDENADIVFCDCLMVDDKMNVLKSENTRKCLEQQTFTTDTLFQDNLIPIEQHWLTVVAWNKLYHKSIFENLRYPFGKYHEDEFLFHHIYSKVHVITCTNERLYFYRRINGSITDKSNYFMRLDRVEALYNRIVFMLEQDYTNSLLRYEKDMFDPIFNVCINVGKKKYDKEKLERIKMLDYEISSVLFKNHLFPIFRFLNRILFIKCTGAYIFIWKVFNKLRFNLFKERV